MTDNDIIKALECCTVCSSIETCGECPYVECPTRKGCVGEMVKDALDLINRLQYDVEIKESVIKTLFVDIDKKKAEIERLQNAYKQCAWERDIFLDELKTAKSEAIKEFAERLKEEATVDDDSTWWVANIDIDNLVKEMVGE